MRTPQASFAKSAYGSKSNVEMVIGLVCHIRFARRQTPVNILSRDRFSLKKSDARKRNFVNRLNLI
jgi:hypothetical protein